MSRFVRLSEGHYINLDLVTDIVIASYKSKEFEKWTLRFLFNVPDGDGDQLTSDVSFKTEAEARAELARILPESTHPECRITKSKILQLKRLLSEHSI